MHILISLLGAAGMLLFFLWRIQQAALIARDVADAAGEAKGLVRRWRWRRKVNVNPLDLINDPREAASVLMVTIAQADGRMTDLEQTAIADQIQTRFGATPQQAGELIARTQWMVKEGVDTREIMRRLTPVVREGTTAEQRRDIIAMLTTVAEVSGRRDETTAFDIDHFQRQIGA